jgi:hypothetical protein
LVGKSEEANALVLHARSCAEDSALLYTISENAGTLYQRYIQSEEALAKEAFGVAQKCTDILKERGRK